MAGDDADPAARLATATTDLYAAHPDAFMAARTELVRAAKADGVRGLAGQIGGLRKPTVAAWVVNQVVRRRAEVVEDLEDIGDRLRQAQSQLDAAGLQGLRAERDAAIAQFVDAACAVAGDEGRDLSDAVLGEVRSTAIAALADEEATRAVASGALTRSLAYAGFGEVDVSDAVARSASGAILTVLTGSGGRAGRAAEAGGSAGSSSDSSAHASESGSPGTDPDGGVDPKRIAAAETAVAGAEAAVATARERAQEWRTRVERLEGELDKARRKDEQARAEVTAAQRKRREAQAALAELRPDHG